VAGVLAQADDGVLVTGDDFGVEGMIMAWLLGMIVGVCLVFILVNTVFAVPGYVAACRVQGYSWGQIAIGVPLFWSVKR
jgi:riboflavin transporter FmnP